MSQDAPFDPRFTLLREALWARPRHDYAPDSAPSAQASVSLVLRQAPSLEVLFIKRAKTPCDPWSGQMALPGGKRDAADSTLLATAIRETVEETGVVLSESDHYLGTLDQAAPWTADIPTITIHPFVFGVPGETVAMPDRREVDSVHWASIEALRDPANAHTVDWQMASGPGTFPAYRVDGQVVWGLTYRILTDFLVKAADGL